MLMMHPMHRYAPHADAAAPTGAQKQKQGFKVVPPSGGLPLMQQVRWVQVVCTYVMGWVEPMPPTAHKCRCVACRSIHRRGCMRRGCTKRVCEKRVHEMRVHEKRVHESRCVACRESA